MNPEDRLAAIVAALESVGLSCLIMGGHAVRFYGLQRFTNDFDLTLSPAGWDDLVDRLARTGLFPGGRPTEGNSWRPAYFRRFLLGNLPNGAEEWLEFWKSNHLLDPSHNCSRGARLEPTADSNCPFSLSPTSFAVKRPNARRTGMTYFTWRSFSTPDSCSARRRHDRHCFRIVPTSQPARVRFVSSGELLRGRRSGMRRAAMRRQPDYPGVPPSLDAESRGGCGRGCYRATRRTKTSLRGTGIDSSPFPRRSGSPAVQGLLSRPGQSRQGSHSNGDDRRLKVNRVR